MPIRTVRATAWWTGLAAYLLVLVATGMAGPYWTFWLWSAGALPAYVAAARRHRAPYGRMLAAWLALALGVPALATPVAAAAARRVPWIAALAPLAAVVTATTVLWPAVVTALAHRLASAHARRAAG